MIAKKVLISAGHNSNSDPGAVSGPHVEAKLALRLRDAVAANLAARGISVLEDGADGVNKPLPDAIALCRQVPGRAVEFHLNAAVNPKATGIEALATPNNKLLAQRLALAVSAATSLPVRGEKGYKPDTSGQHSRLGFARAGGVVLELAFISNPNDVKSYLANEKEVARNIADVMASLV